MRPSIASSKYFGVPARAVSAAMTISTAICTTVVQDAIVAIRTACWDSIEEPAHRTWLPPLALAIWLGASHLQFGCTPSSFSAASVSWMEAALVLGYRKGHPAPRCPQNRKEVARDFASPMSGFPLHSSPSGTSSRIKAMSCLPCSVAASGLRAYGQPLAGLSLPSCSP